MVSLTLARGETIVRCSLKIFLALKKKVKKRKRKMSDDSKKKIQLMKTTLITLHYIQKNTAYEDISDYIYLPKNVALIF